MRPSAILMNSFKEEDVYSKMDESLGLWNHIWHQNGKCPKKWALLQSHDDLVGGKARIAVWKPNVESGTNEFSSAQIWVVSNDHANGFSTLEVGWQVNPALYKDSEPHFFIYWSGQDRRIIDCVHIMDQPGLDHPLLKNHTVQMRPSAFLMNSFKDEDAYRKMNESLGLWNHIWRKDGKCPKNTVPIIRQTREDLLGEVSIKKKKQLPPLNRSYGGISNKHEWALIQSQGEVVGGKARIAVWKPYVEWGTNEFSLAQMWAVSDNHANGFSTLEAGWQVYPALYKDTEPHFFVYWTDDSYVKTGCYNSCPGFVQTNNEVVLGSVISPTSIYDGDQQEFLLQISRDPVNKQWWLALNGVPVGYWPTETVKGMGELARRIDFGGEIVNEGKGQHTTTEMGSGHLPDEGFKRAAYFSNIQTIDTSNQTRSGAENLIPLLTHGNCYTLIGGTVDRRPGGRGAFFYYGGPGRRSECP
ncbi:PREDICTED: uncharacterized protein LOC104817589 [Tarenaya hassleriana]|uniref:uncharacterized protein LOC104817589 n=1 Tax=Tarenaya hassleriana TaxID=28532 RepID=UPI00053C7F0B|nr:PREDICTED: uncharacterized protein LOC104817589 [Tarenaya hassleriana]